MVLIIAIELSLSYFLVTSNLLVGIVNAPDENLLFSLNELLVVLIVMPTSHLLLKAHINARKDLWSYDVG